MVIDKTILQNEEPRHTRAIWADPEGESITLKIFNNGKWRPINGSGGSGNSGSGCNCDTNQNTVTLTSETTYNDLKTLYDAAIIEKGLNKTNEELSNMSDNEYNAYMEEYMHALKDTTFISDSHGKSVNVFFDNTQNPEKINILYEDGYVVSYRNGYDTEEIPPTMRYCYGRDGQYVSLWDEFGERNIDEGNAHTLTTVLYEPDTGRVYNLVYINPNSESQPYPTYSKWVTHYQYTSDDVVEDRIDYITLARQIQIG